MKKLFALLCAGILVAMIGCGPKDGEKTDETKKPETTTPNEPKKDDATTTTPTEPKKDDATTTTPTEPKKEDPKATDPKKDETKKEETPAPATK